MNKRELACLVAKDTKKTLVEVIPVVNSMVRVMANTILEKETVCFTLLGTFNLRPRPQRKGYDPYRKVPIIIPGGMSLEFKTSPSMRAKIKEKYSQKITQEEATATTEP